MTDPIARELAFTYGALTIGLGGVPNIHPTGRYRREWGRRTVSVEFDFFLHGDNEAHFAALVDQVEAQYRIPYQAFTVTQGAQIVLAIAKPPTDKATASIVKSADIASDTGRTRSYTVRIEGELSAANHPDSGLAESAVDVSYSPSERKTVRISGTYTGVVGSTARAKYEAAIAAYATSVLAADGDGATYELLEEPRTTRDDQNHTLDFERVYQEIIFGQAGSGNSATLAGQRLDIKKVADLPGDSDRLPSLTAGGQNAPETESVRRLTTYELSYEVNVLSSVSTDLKSVYEGTLRNWLIQRLKQTFENTGTMALILEEPEFNPDENTIRVRMQGQAAVDGQTIIERRISVQDDDDDRETLQVALDGNRFSRYAYDAYSPYTRTITENAIYVGDVALADILSRGRRLADQLSALQPGNGQWTRPKVTPSVTPIRKGDKADNQVLTETSLVVFMEFYRTPTRSGGTTTTAPPRPRPGNRPAART